MKSLVFALPLFTMALSGLSFAFSAEAPRGNITFQSFNKAKKVMEHSVIPGYRVTLYCQASFDEDKNVKLPVGFKTSVHQKRVSRVEWEHVVPAENFGRFFTEWREGSPRCIDNRGRAFKGRKCAEKMLCFGSCKATCITFIRRSELSMQKEEIRTLRYFPVAFPIHSVPVQ